MMQQSGFSWSPDFQQRMQARLEKAQEIADKMILAYAEPYTPRQTDGLINSAVRGTQIGSGILIWDCPQAHYLNEGRVMGPNIPIMRGGQLAGFLSHPKPEKKHYTGRLLTYRNAPQRGAHWVERMKEERMQELMAAIEEELRRQGGNP